MTANRTRIGFNLPTESYCVLPWTGSAVAPGGQVVPCCRWMGPHGDLDNAPSITNGLTNARNSSFWKTIRQQMILGEKPAGCKICWDEELATDNREGQRMIHQHQLSSMSMHGPITSIENVPVKLRFLETGISNLCNFACVMCNESVSSTIYGIQHPGKKIPKRFHQDSAYIDDDLSELQQLKFVGGEPMMESKHDELLEKVIKQLIDPSQLVIEYHTNCSIFPSDRVLACWKKIKGIKIILSMDGVGKKATLQRPGRYKWEDVEATLNKYVALSSEVNITFSANVVLTALNIGQVTDICEWLYDRIGHLQLSWFNISPIKSHNKFKYIDFRKLNKETKERIKEEWATWEHPVKNCPEIMSLYHRSVQVIDEAGTLDEPLTRKIILENHPYNKMWEYFNEDLSELNI